MQNRFAADGAAMMKRKPSNINRKGAFARQRRRNKNMKKMISAILAALMLVLLFAGCAAKKSEGPQAGTDEITASLDGSTPGSITQTGTIDLKTKGAAYWDTFRGGIHYSSEVGKAVAKVYASYDEFAKDYSSVSPDIAERYSAESFKGYFIVAVSYIFSGGGCSLSLKEGVIKGNTVRVDITTESPAPGTMTTAALEEHTIFIAFPAEEYKESLSLELLFNGVPYEAGAKS